MSTLAERVRFTVKRLRLRGTFHDLIGWSLTYVQSSTGHRFTATLTPRGRGSTIEDWNYLGHVAAAIGAPGPDKFTPPSILSDPNGTHVWEWEE